jgi:hypothetical protein
MTTADVVATVTETYRADGVTVLPRSAVVRELKDHSADVSVAHEDVRAAFEEAGWAYSKHLYYQPEGLAERAGVIADSLRTSGRLLVSEPDVLDRVADPTPSGTEPGWKDSDAVDIVREQFAAAGWERKRATKPESNSTASRVFYFRPLRDVVGSEYPNGSGQFTTDDLFSWYLAQSVQQPPAEE